MVGTPRAEGKAAGKAKKTSSGAAKRALASRAPKVIENTKNALFLRGNKTNEASLGLLKELHAIRKPHGKMLQRKNPIHPFDDDSSIEFLCTKNDASLFVLANHSKKRPNNVVVGRLFDNHILDMIELGIDRLTTVQQRLQQNPAAETKRLGAKPCVLFLGDMWENNEEYKSVRSLLLDMVRGDEVQAINLASLDHVIVFTAAVDRIYMRTYTLLLKKPSSGTTAVPNSKILLSAPNVDFNLRRSRWPSRDQLKAACRQPKELKSKKVKNITTNALGETLGRVHMTKQDWSKMQTRKVRALDPKKALSVKRSREEEGNDDGGDEDGGARQHSDAFLAKRQRPSRREGTAEDGNETHDNEQTMGYTD